MSKGVLTGENANLRLSRGITPLEIDSLNFGTDVTLVGDNKFTLADLQDHLIEISLRVAGFEQNVEYTIELFNVTLSSVVASASKKAQNNGVFNEVQATLAFTVSDAAHEYQIRIRALNGGAFGNAALNLGAPAFSAVIQAFLSTGGGGGGGAPGVPVDSVQFNSPLGTFAGDASFLFTTVGTKTLALSGAQITANPTGLGTSNEAFGSGAGATLAAGAAQNTILGNTAGAAITTGDDNLIAGFGSAPTLTTGSDNVILGSLADVDAAGRSSVVVVGYQAQAAVSGVAVGFEAGQNSTAPESTYVGFRAGESNSSGNERTTAVGALAAQTATGTFGLTAIGYRAGNTSTGAASTFVGGYAGDGTGAGENVTYMGWGAGYNATGDYNIGIGEGALEGGGTHNSNRNVVIGAYDFAGPFSAVNDTVFIGFEAGLPGNADQCVLIGSGVGAGVTGSNNVAIGFGAGATLTSGQHNVLLGRGSATTAAGSSNQFNVGSSASPITTIRFGEGGASATAGTAGHSITFNQQNGGAATAAGQAGASVTWNLGDASNAAGAGDSTGGAGGSMTINLGDGGDGGATNGDGGDGGSLVINPGSGGAASGAGSAGSDGVVLINGKLTVTGSIDPTDLTLSGGGTAHFIEWGNGTTAAVAPAGTGRLRYNDTTKTFQASVDGGAYANIGSGGGIGGSGTTNALPKFTAATTIGDSRITDDGTTINFVEYLRLRSGAVPAAFDDGVGSGPEYFLRTADATSGGNGANLYIRLGSGDGAGVDGTLIVSRDETSTIDSVFEGGSVGVASFMSSNVSGTNLAIAGAGTNGVPRLVGIRTRGSLSAPTAVSNNDQCFRFTAGGYDGTTSQTTASVNFIVDGTVSAGVVPQAIEFETGDTNTASRTVRMTIGPTGDVTIAGTISVIPIGAGAGNEVYGADAGAALAAGGTNNTFVGNQAGNAVVTGDLNTLVGKDAGLLSTSSNNVFIGASAGATGTSGGSNVIIGRAADLEAGDDSGAVAIGDSAIVETTAIAIGSGATALAEGAIAIGQSADVDTTAVADKAIAIGHGANVQASSGGVALGFSASITGTAHVVIGNNAFTDTGSSNCVVVGDAAGVTGAGTHAVVVGMHADAGSSDECIFIGHAAGISTQTGDYNIGIGGSALDALTTGTQTVAIGQSAGGAVTESSNHVFIGYLAGATITTGEVSVFIGSLSDATAAATNSAVAVGYATNAASSCVAIGASTNATAMNAIAVGAGADAGHASIALGQGATTTAANQLVIGGATAITNVFVGNGVVNASPSSVTLQPSGASGTDVAGSNLTIATGRSTGDEDAGELRFSFSPAGGSGTTLNANVQSLAMRGDQLPAEFTAAADTDGIVTYFRGQSGGTHSSNNPIGGDIIFFPGNAGSGGTGRKGRLIVGTSPASGVNIWSDVNGIVTGGLAGGIDGVGDDLTIGGGQGRGSGDAGDLVFGFSVQGTPGTAINPIIDGLKLNGGIKPTAFAAAADTDGIDMYFRAQSGGAHTANDPRGGDISWYLGAAGSGGSGRPGRFDITNTGGTATILRARAAEGVASAGLLNQVVVEPNTAESGTPNAIDADQTNTYWTNEGATAENHHDLPSCAAGLVYTFIVQDADGMQVNAASGDTIRIAGDVSASGGLVESTTVGDVVMLVGINATEWIAVSVVGTWTVT